MTQDITSLIEKLEGAGEGSRELDREVWLACRQPEKWGGPINPPGKGVWEGPHVSYSLDAALALASRVLPGVMWWLSHQAVIDGVKYYHAEVSPETEIEGQSGYAATPALALCAAILRAQSEAR